VSRAANVSRARQLHQSSETVLLELTEIPLEKTERRNQLARSRLEIGTIVANWQQDTFKGPSAAWRALLARARARALRLSFDTKVQIYHCHRIASC